MASAPSPSNTPLSTPYAALMDALSVNHVLAALLDASGQVLAVTDSLRTLLGVSLREGGRLSVAVDDANTAFRRAHLADAEKPSEVFAWLDARPADSAPAPRRLTLGAGTFKVARRIVDDDAHLCTFVDDAASVPSPSLHRELLDGVPGMIYRCRNDRAWTMEFVSRGAFEFCGYTAQELLEAETVSYGHDVIFSQDQERLWNEVQEAIAKKEDFEVEYRIVRKDGLVRWALERGRGVFDRDGNLSGLEGLMVDITNTQVLREELRYARYLLRAVYDASPDALVIFSERGTILDANEGFTRLFGYTPDALVGFDPSRLVARGEDRQTIVSVAKNVLRGEEVDVEAALKHQDGSIIPVELRLRRFEDDMGRRFVVALIRDQREQQRAREALQRSEQRYRQMFEGNHAVKLLIDPTSGSLIDVNAAASAFYGYSREELLEMKIQEINTAHPDDVGDLLDRAAERQEMHFEFRHRRRDGTLVDVEVHSGPVLIDGRKLLYSIVHDISERRRLERELRASQRMEALGRLAGGIAHDFNNLMTVVSASATLAQQELPPEATAKSHLVQIRGAARRAAELTRQLLAFGRRQVLEPQVVNVHNVISGVDAMLEGLLANSAVELVRELDATVYDVKVDVAGLEQVLINLVLNSRDALDGAGQIRICTQDVTLDESIAVAAEIPPGRYLLLSVEDDGEGISAEHIGSIFDPFFSTKPSGTGLGLSSVYGIIKQSGGHIEVESTRGEGTRFDVFLPLIGTRADSAGRIRIPNVDDPEAMASLSWAPLHQSSEEKEASGPHPQRPRALVVEDTDVVRRLITLLLESDGWHVLTAADGAEALALTKARNRSLDLLVTDIRMPKMGGQELAERLRQSTPWLPVLFVSGWLDDVPLHTAGRADVSFMQKPPEPDELLRIAKELLEEGRRSKERARSQRARTREMRTLSKTDIRTPRAGASNAAADEATDVDRAAPHDGAKDEPT